MNLCVAPESRPPARRFEIVHPALKIVLVRQHRKTSRAARFVVMSENAGWKSANKTPRLGEAFLISAMIVTGVTEALRRTAAHAISAHAPPARAWRHGPLAGGFLPLMGNDLGKDAG